MKEDTIPTWTDIFAEEKEASYFKKVFTFAKNERAKGKAVYPAPENIFRAFTLTPFVDVRVVILGQDPYHGAGQAEGLSFSVPKGIATPPSLQNIYKELRDDIGTTIPKHGHLEHWAKQGVLLLNAVLTVEAGKASSHAGRGWEQFTDAVIKKLSEHKEHLVFILWGNYAKSKIPLIEASKHTILTSPHPSPFSAYSGFFGSKPFSKTNTALESYGFTPIDWQIPEE